MVSDHDIARWRLRTQYLTAPAPGAAAVVEGLLAVQAENRQQAGWAVACRTVDPRAAELDRLLAEGAVVRTHVLRPTWHFVTADDVGWLLELTAPRVRPVVLRQLTELHGWSSAGLDLAATTVCEELAQRPDQDRGQLAAALAERGLVASGQVMMLLLGLLELDRLVCSGRERDGAHTYALLAERVGERRRRGRDEALAELARRYVVGHGPATERDLAYWATLTLTDARRGLEHAREQLDTFAHDGRTYWHAPGEPPTGPQEPAGHLLQLVDETYRGYQDSRMVLDVAGVVPRGRETAIGIALVDAQLVGSMRRTVGTRVRFDVVPYRPLTASDEAALEDAAARYGAFLGREHELRVHR
ncbi:crosslink repair DNA glycosylase YcaQ family protein [Georgenia phoenicis]|uniref:DNA glycosylase AlkZ-like family protein n=1 Tax=unclassified Georgenia TaxID=2626815 RepID=UPI0039B0C5C4